MGKSEALLQQRAAFADRVRKANYLEYWAAGYRTTKPDTGVVPCLWSWKEMKQLMLESEKLIDINEAERRGLILLNPGLGGKPYMTNTIFGDVQILAPGEKAPAHRHTTSASRFFLEGEGGYTTVEGEKCTMGPGDLIINPSWAWHDHGHEGKDDISYLNILDVPLVASLGCVFYDSDYAKVGDASRTIQTVRKPVNASHDFYASGGIVPRIAKRSNLPYTTQLIYRFSDAMGTLKRISKYEPDPYDGHIVEYVSPESGASVVPTLSFTMQMLQPGVTLGSHRHTSSTVYCCAGGSGVTEVDGVRLEWTKNDMFAIPTWAWHSHTNLSASDPALLFAVTDSPAIQKLSLYREEGRSASGEIISLAMPA
jgi:gentisate 1,2-dioxygenase